MYIYLFNISQKEHQDKLSSFGV